MMEYFNGLLDEIAKLEQAAFESGETPLSSVLLARGDLLEATLEITEDYRTQVAILKDHVGIVKKLEKAVQHQVDTSEAKRVDLLKAKAARLKLEAHLEAVSKEASR